MLLSVIPGTGDAEIEGTTYPDSLSDYNLLLDLKLSEILDSQDLKDLISNSRVTLTHDGHTISDPAQIFVLSNASGGVSFPIYAGHTYDEDGDTVDTTSEITLIASDDVQPAGTYRITLSFIWEGESTSHGFEMEVKVDGDTVLFVSDVKSASRSEAVPATLIVPVSHPGGVLDIEVLAKAQKKDKDVTFKNIFLQQERIV